MTRYQRLIKLLFDPMPVINGHRLAINDGVKRIMEMPNDGNRVSIVNTEELNDSCLTPSEYRKRHFSRLVF